MGPFLCESERLLRKEIGHGSSSATVAYAFVHVFLLCLTLCPERFRRTLSGIILSPISLERFRCTLSGTILSPSLPGKVSSHVIWEGSVTLFAWKGFVTLFAGKGIVARYLERYCRTSSGKVLLHFIWNDFVARYLERFRRVLFEKILPPPLPVSGKVLLHNYYLERSCRTLFRTILSYVTWNAIWKYFSHVN